MNKLSRTLVLTVLLAAAPLAGAFAGQGSASDAGTHIYSPSPLIVNTAGAGPNGSAATEKGVRIADADSVGTTIYQPGPLTTQTRHERLVSEINETYGTTFATHPQNEALAMNNPGRNK
jgi:hypothetical protein